MNNGNPYHKTLARRQRAFPGRWRAFGRRPRNAVKLPPGVYSSCPPLRPKTTAPGAPAAPALPLILKCNFGMSATAPGPTSKSSTPPRRPRARRIRKAGVAARWKSPPRAAGPLKGDPLSISSTYNSLTDLRDARSKPTLVGKRRHTDKEYGAAALGRWRRRIAHHQSGSRRWPPAGHLQCCLCCID